MADKSGIEWTDATWNMIRAKIGKWFCERISAGCANCYAERMALRFGGTAYTRAGGNSVYLDADVLTQPLRWRRPRTIFPCSMTDLFFRQVDDDWIAAVFGVMAATPRHTYQPLTKRADRLVRWFESVSKQPDPIDFIASKARAALPSDGKYARVRDRFNIPSGVVWPLLNVHVGVTVEDQRNVKRANLLTRVPAAVRWISVEPMLTPITFAYTLFNGADSFGTWPGIHGVIIGGESQTGSRPSSLKGVRDLRDEATRAGVKVFFKQWGDWAPLEQLPEETRDRIFVRPPKVSRKVDGVMMLRVGKQDAGRRLDGQHHDDLPSPDGFTRDPASGLWLPAV